MDLFTDLLAGLEGHQHQLHVRAGIEHSPVVPILLGPVLDVSDESFPFDS
jgi:hypothetical protein